MVGLENLILFVELVIYIMIIKFSLSLFLSCVLTKIFFVEIVFLQIGQYFSLSAHPKHEQCPQLEKTTLFWFERQNLQVISFFTPSPNFDESNVISFNIWRISEIIIHYINKLIKMPKIFIS